MLFSLYVHSPTLLLPRFEITYRHIILIEIDRSQAVIQEVEICVQWRVETLDSAHLHIDRNLISFMYELEGRK